MRRLFSCGTAASTRLMATQAFVTAVDQIQQQLQTAQDRRTELLRYGRQLYETEQLDDLKIGYTPAAASKVCHVAAQLHINAAKGTVYASTIDASMTQSAVDAMDMASLARIVHSCLILRSSYSYDLLFTYIPSLIQKASTMDAVTTAVLINAYGRSGVHHHRLYQTLCDAGATTLKDPRVSLAHVANVAYALSRVQFLHRPLMLVLRDHALRKVSEASPIISITILESFTELGQVDEELFDVYEQRLLGQLGELQAPLMASLISCVVRAGRSKEELMQSLGARVVALAEAFDAASIAKVCATYYEGDIASEDVFGALAERACKVATDFRSDEIHDVLNALSSFDLFDAELFPLLASRFSALCRQGGYVSVKDAAGILASFAAVQERNDELIHACTQVFAGYPGTAMDAISRINALWACATLNVHNEAQMRLVEETRRTPSLLRQPATTKTSSKVAALLVERMSMVSKVYGIDEKAMEAV